MDAIKFLADCIRAEQKAEAERARQLHENANKVAGVEDTVRAVTHNNNPADDTTKEDPKPADKQEDTQENQPEDTQEKGDDK